MFFYSIPYKMCEKCVEIVVNDVIADDAEVLVEVNWQMVSKEDCVYSEYEWCWILQDEATQTEDEWRMYSDNATYCELQDAYYYDVVETYDWNWCGADCKIKLYNWEYAYENDDDVCEANNGWYYNSMLGDDYFVCNCCDNIYSMEYYREDGECEDCAPEWCAWVREYSDNPDVKLYTVEKNDYIENFGSYTNTNNTYGIEMEFNEAEDYENEYRMDKMWWFLFAKEDGSLHNWVEFVSHAFDIERYKQNKNRLAEFIESVEWETDNWTWLHIHIGRASLSQQQIENITYLVNHNVAERALLSWRNNEQRAKQYKDDEDGTCVTKSSKNRYSAVNLCPKNTIEIRTFRMSKNPKHILGRIELTMSMVEYCKKGRQRNGLYRFCQGMVKKHWFENLKWLFNEKWFEF